MVRLDDDRRLGDVEDSMKDNQDIPDKLDSMRSKDNNKVNNSKDCSNKDSTTNRNTNYNMKNSSKGIHIRSPRIRKVSRYRS